MRRIKYPDTALSATKQLSEESFKSKLLLASKLRSKPILQLSKTVLKLSKFSLNNATLTSKIGKHMVLHKDNLLIPVTLNLHHKEVSYKQRRYEQNNVSLTLTEQRLKRLHKILGLVNRAFISLFMPLSSHRLLSIL